MTRRAALCSPPPLILFLASSQMAVKACPYRADFYKSLGGDPAKLIEDMKSYFDAYAKVTKALVDFFIAEKLEDKA